MRRKRLWSLLLACVLVLGCSAVPVGAIDTADDNAPILRVSNRINQSISANSIVAIEDWFYLDVGDTVGFNCTYSPKSASIDFGIVSPNGVFQHLNCTSGSFDKSIKISQTGQYTLAIRNNESYAVTVTGTIRY